MQGGFRIASWTLKASKRLLTGILLDRFLTGPTPLASDCASTHHAIQIRASPPLSQLLKGLVETEWPLNQLLKAPPAGRAGRLCQRLSE